MEKTEDRDLVTQKVVRESELKAKEVSSRSPAQHISPFCCASGGGAAAAAAAVAVHP